MGGKAAKAYWRNKRTEDINRFLEDCGFNSKWYTEYHCRVWAFDNAFDFFPTNGKYHDLNKDAWGDYHTIEDLYKITSGEE